MLKKLMESIVRSGMKSLVTNDMARFFEERTKMHIEGVRTNIEKIIAKMTELDKEKMLERAEGHDKAKYSKEEKIPYIHLTCAKRDGKEVPKRLNGVVGKAIQHHYSQSSHHPEYHEKPSDMSKYDLAEMVADIAAVSQEKNGNLPDWIEKNVLTRKFTEDQKKFIMRLVDVLENK